jgi:anti-sigma B factor antagonist
MAEAHRSAILAPEGEIDLHHSAALKQQLDEVLAASPPRLVLDLSGVSYVDSSGLAVMIEALQRVQGYGGRLILCGLRDGLRHIFSIARLDQVFSIHEDRSAALAAP